jgi:hypothetical protein
MFILAPGDLGLGLALFDGLYRSPMDDRALRRDSVLLRTRSERDEQSESEGF